MTVCFCSALLFSGLIVFVCFEEKFLNNKNLPMNIKTENVPKCNSKQTTINQSFWMYEEALRMIDFVKSKPFLYDRKDVDYNKNQKKNSAWEKISEILQNKSPKECKRKWSTLRIQQRRILLQNIARKRKSSHWQFYEPLQFLLPHMEVNSNADTARSSYSDESENDESESITYIESDNKNFNLCQMDTTTENRTFDANSQVILSYPSDQQQEHFTASEQNEHLNQSIVVSKADTITHSQESQCHMHNKNDISLNYFLMDVQLQMNKLNDLAQMELKIDIQKMILEKLRKSENLRNDG